MDLESLLKTLNYCYICGEELMFNNNKRWCMLHGNFRIRDIEGFTVVIGPIESE